MYQMDVEIEPHDGSATRRAYLQLKSMIVSGDLKPGEKLKIDSLRQRLLTGASPIREALSLLTSDNLVERLDQRGFRAAEVSEANFKEILTLRCTLEDLALRESIRRATDDWEEKVVLAHHRMKRIDFQDASFESHHKLFHMTLLQNASSPILLRYCSQLYDLNIRYRHLAGQALDHQERNIGEEHSGILEAAVARDADLACVRLIAHYKRTGDFLAELFRSGMAI
jgi:DNA-binding GntR family transcriptional regulator